jgi:hypothetical protein
MGTNAWNHTSAMPWYSPHETSQEVDAVHLSSTDMKAVAVTKPH